MKITLILLFSVFLLNANSYAQISSQAFDDEEDLNIGGDIFQDFNEDLEAQQVMEDERFYRYARFFGLNIGLGFTTFTDNRGLAYQDDHPTFSFSLLYFMDFQNAIVMGIEYSKHTMFIDTFVNGSKSQILGAIETNMLRPFIGFRYYLDTSDLGTAITYSNPYAVGRIEYWYQTNVFAERDSIGDQVGGGLGTGIGFGLEFPIEIKKSYFNIEFLYHRVNFFDKFTQDYRQIPDGEEEEDDDENTLESEFGFDDLRGDVISIIMNYNITW
jgi:hypothetical protein